jgi:hypothetical protein
MQGAVVKTKKGSQEHFGKNRVLLVPGNERRGIVGHGGAADPPRVHMNEPRWYKLREMGTIGAMAFAVRV